ncbi:MAG: hypothetical protein AMXMBFR4_18230 [Candidatus Hydrogenedentota bacterium]
MAQDPRLTGCLSFCAKLIALAPVCLVVWWLALPSYAWIVGRVSRLALTHAAGYPIDHVVVHPGGILNTNTTLGFALGDRTPSAPVANIMSNTAVFIALVLSTANLEWKRRAISLAAGAFILFATHVAYAVIWFTFAPAIERDPQIPMAIGQLFVTLPFVLWIATAYWRNAIRLFRKPGTYDADPHRTEN